MSYSHKFDDSKNYLILCEKASQIKAFNYAVPDIFKKNNVRIEALSGHIFSLCDLAEYSKDFEKNWAELVKNNHLPFTPSSFKRKLIKGTNASKIYTRVKEATKWCDHIILACDPDNEGMALGYEVILSLGEKNKIIGAFDTSKLDPSSLRDAVGKISHSWYAMAQAGFARAEYDWVFGINATVMCTVLLGNGQTLHIGGVKLPIMRIVVDREKQISTFKVEKYFTISGKVTHEKSSKQWEYKVLVGGEEKFSENSSNQMTQFLSDNPNFFVSKFEHEKNLKHFPPRPFSLTDLQFEAGKKFNFSPSDTLSIAQSLYEKGAISYPRTDCTYYSKGQMKEMKRILDSLIQGKWDELGIERLYKPSRNIFDDSKVTAHTALSPTMMIPKNLEENQLKIYKLICERYIMQFMKIRLYDRISVVCTSKKDKKVQISASELVETEKGWRKINSDEYSIETKRKREIPNMKVNDICRIDKSAKNAQQTQPPPRFTECSLLKSLERVSTLYPEKQELKNLKNGIGTPATRASILKKLISEKYLLKSGKSISPSPKASYVIEIVPEQVSSPVLRARIESSIIEISKDPSIVDHFRKEYSQFINNLATCLSKSAKNMKIEPSAKRTKTHFQPTVRQLQYAKRLENEKKLKIPVECLSDRNKMSQWISEHKLPERTIFQLSEKQKKILVENCQDQKILECIECTTKEDYQKVSSWISKFFATQSKNKKRKK